MTPEEAVRTAVSYEKKIRDLYREAAERLEDSTARRILQALADDEANHVAYLEERLGRWKREGVLTGEDLESSLPSREIIDREVGKLRRDMTREAHGDQKRMLAMALQLEMETSEFYRRMVEQMPDPARGMFARFLEIEDSHIAAVQAELDYLTRTGYWFDFKEFDME